MILQNAFVSINGVDLSCEVREINVEDGRAEHDNTVVCHTAESVEAGLAQWTISLKFRQNYAPGKVNATLRPLIGSNVTVVVRPDQGVPSPENEQVTGIGLFSKYNPISGSAGQPMEPQIEVKNAGTPLAYASA